MVIVLATVFSFGTFTISTLEFLRIQTGVPANDAVSLSANQSRLLAWEGTYLLPFLHRKLGFEGSGGLARGGGGGGGHKDVEGGSIAEEEEGGGGGGGGGGGEEEAPTSPASASNPGLARRGSMGGSVFGSFMHNDLIDTIFRRDSMGGTATTGGGGGGVLSPSNRREERSGGVLSPSQQFGASHQGGGGGSSNSESGGAARVV